MFDYPAKAEFNRTLPKTKIYEFAHPARAVRARFASQIREIVWKYKLSPETVNLPAAQGIEEIQIFTIALKTAGPAITPLHPVLLTIDKAIPSPVFYQLTFADRIKFAAAWKRPSESDAAKSVVNSYFETPWQPVTVALSPLPVALDLAGLYDQMLRRHMTIPARPGEPLREHVERMNQIRAKETECRHLDARLGKERQFNRKVEINAALRQRKSELAQLQ